MSSTNAEVPTVYAAAPATPASDAAHRHCGDCGTPLQGKYCHACGQVGHVHHSLLHLLEEMLHGVLHFDTKGIRTLPLLIFKPGELTRRYIDGQRTRYVSPLALFLFCIFLMFLVFSLTDHGSPDAKVTVAKGKAAAAELAASLAEAKTDVAKARTALEAARRSGSDTRDAASALDDAVTTEKLLETTVAKADPLLEAPSAAAAATPAADADTEPQDWNAVLTKMNVNIHTGSPAMDTKLKHLLKNPDLLLYKLKSLAYKFSFLLIPISLPFLWLMFVLRRDVAVYDHAVFSMYSLSFMSLLFIVVDLLGAIHWEGLEACLVLIVPPVHMYAQLKATYRLGRFGALWRTAALMLVAGIVFSLFLAVIIGILLH
jgi:hypothetical protein